MNHTDNALPAQPDDQPFFLYKFRPINKWLIESLLNRSLYFAKPSALNDPFDCSIDLRKVFAQAESSATGDRKRFISSFLTNPEFFRIWQSTLANIGVCSFSRSNDNTLLWSHYADQHRGVCLKHQFRPEYLKNEDFHLAACGDVQYLTGPLMECLNTAPLDLEPFVSELARRYLRTKSSVWKYEEEDRILRHEPGAFSFNSNEPFLNQICFGLRTENADIALIANLAQTYTDCTKFSQMIHDETGFGFKEEVLQVQNVPNR